MSDDKTPTTERPAESQSVPQAPQAQTHDPRDDMRGNVAKHRRELQSFLARRLTNWRQRCTRER